ncbi:hypothetical protein AEQU1_00133 [Aequorivita sp. CIP111184]|nr:hypothetical protein AEQU1_00133 [Aequorivita sp. CIP111184]
MYRAYETARRISFNDDSKFIIFSDCHRGDNSFADDFAKTGISTFMHCRIITKKGLLTAKLAMAMNFGKIFFLRIFMKHTKMFMS